VEQGTPIHLCLPSRLKLLNYLAEIMLLLPNKARHDIDDKILQQQSLVEYAGAEEKRHGFWMPRVRDESDSEYCDYNKKFGQPLLVHLSWAAA